MKQIKNYLKKYHEANLWITEKAILEEKKKALGMIEETNVQTQQVAQPVSQHAQIIFSHYDIGHNEEEKNKIQQIYSELEDLVRMPTLAI